MRLILEARAPSTRNGARPLAGRPDRQRRRLWLVLLVAFVLAGSMGARHCWQVLEVPEGRTFAEAEADLRAGCVVNGCTPEQLEALLRSLRTTYNIEEVAR